MEDHATSLVLVGCSRRKRTTPGLLPAIERYDGPVFRLLRRFLRAPTRPVRIHILSAAYGLIPADHPIPCYDRRMTPARAEELRPAVEQSLCALLREQGVSDTFICMGATYRGALPESAAFADVDTPVRTATGSLGRQLGLLHDWLYGEPPATLAGVHDAGAARVRGIALTMTPDAALASARRALDEKKGAPFAFQSWYVPVDERRVAPKWLVSQLTGLPVSAFSTDEARRVLAQIGVPVQRA
jgi:hypothetical protein